MKLFKQIALSIFLTLGIFTAVVYSSCSKDGCKGITCINGGTCSGSTCICKTGLGGANCETVYRKLFAFPYQGLVRAQGNLDSLTTVDSTCFKNTLVFSADNDTTDYNTMTVSWNDSSSKLIVNMPLKLYNNTLSGSDFRITAVNSDTFTYSGTGNITANSASLILTRSHPHGSSKVVFSFSSFSRL